MTLPLICVCERHSMTVWGNHIWITTDERWQTEIGLGWCQLKMCHPSSPSLSLPLYIYIRLRVHAETRNWHLLMEKPIVAHFFDKHPQCWYIFFYRATFLIPSGIILGWEPRTGSVSQYLGVKQSKIPNKFWLESESIFFLPSITLSSRPLPLLCVCVCLEGNPTALTHTPHTGTSCGSILGQLGLPPA